MKLDLKVDREIHLVGLENHLLKDKKLSIGMKILLKKIANIWTKNLKNFILRVGISILSENIYPSYLALLTIMSTS